MCIEMDHHSNTKDKQVTVLKYKRRCLSVREWKDLTEDEKDIVSTMKTQNLTPEELIQRMRKSGKMDEQAIAGLEKALEDVKPFLVH